MARHGADTFSLEASTGDCVAALEHARLEVGVDAPASSLNASPSALLQPPARTRRTRRSLLAWQACGFAVMLAVCGVWMMVSTSSSLSSAGAAAAAGPRSRLRAASASSLRVHTVGDVSRRRLLTSNNATCALTGGELTLVGLIAGQECCTDREVSCCAGLDMWAGVLFYFGVVLYTFLGLAIICDDYFCESLEAISTALSLSDDVAGATFMAAGSSAPELFTAVVTTLIIEGSEGLGTIVGSAIFNIMVIVGVTAICAGQALEIWWYPLTRDCVVYVISIVAMAAVVVDNEVQWYESMVLVLCYGGYIALMVYNESITDWIESRTAKVEPSTVPSAKSFTKIPSERVTDNDVSAAAAALAAAASKGGSMLAMNPFAGNSRSNQSAHSLHSAVATKAPGAAATDALVAPISSFTSADRDSVGQNGFDATVSALARPVSRHGQLLPLALPDGKQSPGTPSPTTSTTAATSTPPATSSTGTASLLGALKQRPKPAQSSNSAGPPKPKKRGPNPMLRAVNRRSANPDTEAARRKARAQLQVGTLLKVHSAKSILLRRLRARQQARRAAAGGSPAPGPASPASAAAAFGGSGSGLLGKLAASAAKPEPAPPAADKKPEGDEGESSSLQDKVLWLFSLPYIIIFKYTVPDCRTKRWERFYMATFGMSIFWIGVLSFLMVDFAARAGCVLKVPGIVMGLVVIAAGTSVPDALSSILVARNGQGDMAVANVLGSNVFNIFLGLGLPWFLKSLLSDMDPIVLPADENIIIPVIILLGYVVVFVAFIAGNKWRLSAKVGYIFIGAHLLFVAWSLLTMLDNPVIPL